MNRLESLKFLNYFKRTSFKHVFSDITKGPKIVSVRLSSDHDDHHHHHMRPAREVDIEQKTTLNDIPVPSGSWQESYNAKQSKYNMYLLLSVGAFVASGFVIYKYGLFNLYTSPHRSAVGTDFPGAKFVTPSSARFVSAVRDPQSKEPATVVPPTKEEPVNYAPVPEHAPYLIIGGGTAAFSAFRSIRANDPKAKVLVISQEKHKPYMRPPLSKELWFSDNPLKEYKFKQWNGKEKSVFYLHDEFFVEPMQLSTSENGGVAIVNNRKVARLDVQHKKAILENGAEVSFDKCLIATGGRPHNIQSLEEASAEVRQRTTLFRSLDDFERLYNLTKKVKSVAIIGGGFLGSELACALGRKSTETGAKVTQILMESGNMGKVLPTYLSKWTTNKVRGEGVDVVTNVKVTRATFKNGKVALELSNGQETLVDHVIVAVGIDANVELAKQAGLEVDRELGGYHVNAELEARTGVWVAGDAACFYDIKLGRRRVEHHDHAVVSGRLAGENMTGNHKPYWHQSMFWSDLGPEVGYEAIGLVDSSLPTVGVFAKKTDKDTPRAVVEETGESLRSETESVAKPGDESPSIRTPMPDDDYGKGVIFYQKNNVVVGILLWNIFNRMPIARKIIKDQQPVDDFTELAKLFNIHGEE